ncbi:MAG: hypothetical protein L0H64_07340 [Pseudonocardia sp.]|nr:hypothetical protein [Pseudonocardia sp.]
MIEWHGQSWVLLLMGIVVGFGVPGSVLLYNVFVTGEGSAFFTDWSRPWSLTAVLAVPFVGALLLYNHGRREFVGAGAEWVSDGHGWVRTYELIWVAIEIDTKPFLYLVDSDHRACRPTLESVQQNRDLWDLVYNGILHSFQERYVHTNPNARRILQLHGPAMRNDLRLAREGPRPDEFVIVDRPRWWRRTPRRYRRGQRR